MIVHGFVTPPTKDIDLFTEVDEHEARQVVAALRRALEEQDLVTHDTDRPPLDHRFVAVDPTTGAGCTVEVFADGGRLHDRDFFDVAALIDRYGHKRLLELAEAKDSGFTHKTFIDALRAIARLSNADWAEDGINSDDAQRLRTDFDAWRNQLELDMT